MLIKDGVKHFLNLLTKQNPCLKNFFCHGKGVNYISLAILILILAGVAKLIIESRKLNKIMSALKDTLDGLTVKLAAIDEKVKALVAAAQGDTLTPETQAALDALSAEVGTVATDLGV